MTADDFRSIALSLPDVDESEHMDHADFRVRGKIFATLPHAEWGMVKVAPEEQAMFILTDPEIFQPVKGGWGRQGCTQVWLDKANEKAVRSAMIAAWRRIAPKKLASEFDDE